ncbi:hypothetical protein ACHAXR_008362, partial [Thalassiosira sp. AJA248-18]
MPSRTPKNAGVGGDVQRNNKIATGPAAVSANGEARTSRPADASSTANEGKTWPPGQKQAQSKNRNDVQLFAFDAMPGEISGGGRPKRKLKAIARFESMSFDKAAHCKIGEGFSCPRCSAVCSYDSKECEECQLACYYEAGIGVVVLKERRTAVGHDTLTKQAPKEKVARGSDAAAVTEKAGESAVLGGTLTMQRVTMQRNKKRESLPDVKLESQTTKKGSKKRQSAPPAMNIGSSHPTDENDVHIFAGLAEGLPEGWVTRRIPRSGDSSHRGDIYWYSPKNKFKFRSKPDVQRFLTRLGQTNGDESAAILLFKKRFGKGKGRSSSAGRASHKTGSAIVKHDAATKDKKDKSRMENRNESVAVEMGDAKMPAEENAGSKMSSDESAAKSMGYDILGKLVSNITVPAAPNRTEDAATSPSKKAAPYAAGELDASPPPGNVSVRVQLYENELQVDGREDVEVSNRKTNIQQGEAATQMTEQLKGAPDSNSPSTNLLSSLQCTNNELAKVLREKESALRDAEATIAALRQDASSATKNIQEDELNNPKNNRVNSLETSLETEQLIVQDLERQLGDAEDDIVKLTQQNNTVNELNENLRSNLTDVTSQKEKQAIELQGAIKSLQAVAKEKNDLNKKLSELQSKHDVTASTSATTENELRETISKLQVTIRENEESSSEKMSDLNKNLSELQSKHDTVLSNSVNTEKDLRETASKLQASIRENKESPSRDLENTLSIVYSERNELTKKLRSAAAELSAMQVQVSKSSSKIEELQSEMKKVRAQLNTAEKRVTELLSETDSAKESIAAMQSEKDELTMKLDRVNAKLGTLKLENEVRLNKSETVCAEKEKEIATLKQQASKRMSQVYELTDQLSKALTEKTDLVTQLESTAADLSQARDKAESQTTEISQLKSSITSLATHRGTMTSKSAKSSTTEESKAETCRLETGKAEAVATSKSLGNTVCKLQGQIESSKAEIARIETEKAEAVATSKRLGKTVCKLQGQIESSKAEIARIETEKAEAVATSKSLGNTVCKLQGQIESSKVEIARLETKTAEAVATSKSLGNTVCKLQGQIESSKAEIARIETEKSEAVATSRSLGNTVGELQGQIESSKVEIARLETEKAQVIAQSKSLGNTVGELRGQIGRLPAGLDEGSKMEIARLESEKKEAIARSVSLGNTVDELQGLIERLSAELNASKTLSNGLKSQVESANAKCGILESKHKEYLNELGRANNESEKVSPDLETKYKTSIHNLEESINQQNEEMQALEEAVSTSDAQTADLISQVSTLTTERDELKGKVEETMKEVSQLRSTVDAMNTQPGRTEKREQLSGVAHSDEALSAINLEIESKESLLAKVEGCIARLDSNGEETQMKINDINAKVAKMHGQNENQANGINALHLEMSEVLSQAEKIKIQLREEDAEVSKLITDTEKLEAHMKKALQKFKDKYLVTTKDCKSKLKQKNKKLQALKANIAKIKVAKKEEGRPFSSNNKDPSSTIFSVNKVGDEGAMTLDSNGVDDSLVNDELHDDADESNVQLFAFDVTQEEYNWGRPKRKLKAIARFESMTFDSKAAHCKIGEGFSCPRCTAICSYDSKECEDCHLSCYYEAGIGVVVLKERDTDSSQNSNPYHPKSQHASQHNHGLSKSVLCHCPDCDKKDFTMQGLVSHYAKEHSGKPRWQKVTYSCPFCPSIARHPKALGDVEAHVHTTHPGRRILKPTSKKSSNKRQEVGLKNVRTMGERGASAKDRGPPSWAWTRIEHIQLLPDGGKEYPRELPRVIGFIEAQCKKQEENV